ncbi:hypothetical protein ABZ442_05100 [Streptomyces triculaminicus]|uniref:hypothetical protein n=1 Tax=Streptomyces triculaminicus TaxID=2816232 RepID=UPI00340807E1
MSDFEVRHGYSLRDLHRFAATAVAADRSLAGNAHLRYDIAWSAIALALAEATVPPHPQTLVRAGWQAIYADVRQGWQLYGVARDTDDRSVGGAPRFAIYWRNTATEPASETLIEAMAVSQILGTLPDIYREAVTALAAHDTLQAAADSLGISYVAMNGRIRTARKRFTAQWYAPETPPPFRGTDRRVGSYSKPLATHCSKDHEFTPENTRMDRGRTGRRVVRRCRACERLRAAARRGRGAVPADGDTQMRAA